MIDYVELYMYAPWADSPYACIFRRTKMKQYRLTKASASRLGRMCQRMPGQFKGDGLGWVWRRTKETQ